MRRETTGRSILCASSTAGWYVTTKRKSMTIRTWTDRDTAIGMWTKRLLCLPKNESISAVSSRSSGTTICWSERRQRMAEGKLDYRAINILGATFRFRIKRLETEFLFADGSVHIFPNWDVKNLRERFYMEEYINVPTEMYLSV